MQLLIQSCKYSELYYYWESGHSYILKNKAKQFLLWEKDPSKVENVTICRLKNVSIIFKVTRLYVNDSYNNVNNNN